MRRRVLAALFAVMPLAAAPIAVQAEEERSATSLVESPLTDVNLKKKHIPPILIATQAHPYDAAGMSDCGHLAAAVTALDAVLGRDVDAPAVKTNGRHDLAMDAGQDTINSLIPGRFIIRRLSGAEAAQRRAIAAIYAGSVRRGFLKGLGASKGCAPPAGPRR